MQHTELHTYLTLAGNQRLPHLEEEIFADEAATTIYLRKLCQDLEWYCISDSIVCLMYYYAKHDIGNRWLAAEPVIAKDPAYAYYYACCVYNNRWPEAEPYIMKDAQYAHYYASEVIKCRWPEAEDIISTHPFFSVQYNRYFEIK